MRYMNRPPNACREVVTFDASNPLVLSTGSDLIISCPDTSTRVNVYSARVASGASLTLRNCQAVTVQDIQGAADEQAVSSVTSAFLGLNGKVEFDRCHVLLPLAVCNPFDRYKRVNRQRHNSS